MERDSEMERGYKGGDERERGRIRYVVDVVCLLSFRPELYLMLQTGSSVPERPADRRDSGGKPSPYADRKE